MLCYVRSGEVLIRGAAAILAAHDGSDVSPETARRLAAEIEARNPEAANSLRRAADRAEYLANDDG